MTEKTIVITGDAAATAAFGRVDGVVGRAGGAEEVAEAALWLLADQASCVTGAFIDMADGR